MEISIIKIKSIVGSLIEWCRQDLIDNVLTPTESWLYEVFSGATIDDTNFYTSLKSLIEKGNEDKRKLEVRLMFDKERANLPTIHIHYPSEDGRSGDNTLNTGYSGNIGNVNIDKDEYSRSFIGQYELIVTGGNSLEVVMLYEFLDAILIAGADTMGFNFDKFEFSGKQLMANQDIIPHLTFYRAVGLSLQSKKRVPSIISGVRAHNIQFEGVLNNESMQERVVSVTISADKSTVILDEAVTVTATILNGGHDPVINWYLDDVLSTNHTSIFTFNFNSATSQQVICIVESSLPSLLPNPAISNTVVIEAKTDIEFTFNIVDDVIQWPVANPLDVDQWNQSFYFMDPILSVNIIGNKAQLKTQPTTFVISTSVENSLELIDIKYLNKSLGLTNVNLTNAHLMTEVPDLSGLNLNALELFGWSSLVNPPDVSLFPNLQYLQLGNCTSLVSPPDLSNCSELLMLYFMGCSSMTTPPILTGLTKLQFINLYQCFSIGKAGIDQVLTSFAVPFPDCSYVELRMNGSGEFIPDPLLLASAQAANPQCTFFIDPNSPY